MKAISTKVDMALSSTKVDKNRRDKNTSFYKKRWGNKKSFSSSAFNGSKQADKSHSPDAESIFSRWAIQNHDKDITKLSRDEITTIGKYLRSPDLEAIEWREIMWDYWKDTFQEIKRITVPVS